MISEGTIDRNSKIEGGVGVERVRRKRVRKEYPSA
jgi:hypothetical protein